MNYDWIETTERDEESEVEWGSQRFSSYLWEDQSSNLESRSPKGERRLRR